MVCVSLVWSLPKQFTFEHGVRQRFGFVRLQGTLTSMHPFAKVLKLDLS
jgi:hypothetical protein